MKYFLIITALFLSACSTKTEVKTNDKIKPNSENYVYEAEISQYNNNYRIMLYANNSKTIRFTAKRDILTISFENINETAKTKLKKIKGICKFQQENIISSRIYYTFKCNAKKIYPEYGKNNLDLIISK